MQDNFHPFTIRGRYIYGYLCLRNILSQLQLPPLPDKLDEILCQFVSSDRLDVWQDEADKARPSMDDNVLPEFRHYYETNDEIVTDVIDELLWLGVSNLYVGFNTNITHGHIKAILALMRLYDIELPDPGKIKECLIKGDDQWGDRTEMKYFI